MKGGKGNILRVYGHDALMKEDSEVTPGTVKHSPVAPRGPHILALALKRMGRPTPGTAPCISSLCAASAHLLLAPALESGGGTPLALRPPSALLPVDEVVAVDLGAGLGRHLVLLHPRSRLMGSRGWEKALQREGGRQARVSPFLPVCFAKGAGGGRRKKA